MRTLNITHHPGRAFTLLEMTIVLMVLIALLSTGLFISKKTNDWKLGRQASETLRLVYSAQRMYLADNPTASVSGLTNAMLIPYLPNQATTMPTVTSLSNTTLTIIVNVMPPVVNNGNGVAYDPSSSTTDSLWDVGP